MNIKCSYKSLVKIEDFVLHDKNPNEHSSKQIKLLAKLMKNHGIIKPILVSSFSGKVVSGHGRIEAAKFNKWTEMPADLIEIDSEEQEYSILVSDNAVTEYSELNLGQIHKDLEQLGPLDDLEELGILDFNFEPNPEVEIKEKELDETINTEKECPSCGYVW